MSDLSEIDQAKLYQAIQLGVRDAINDRKGAEIERLEAEQVEWGDKEEKLLSDIEWLEDEVEHLRDVVAELLADRNRDLFAELAQSRIRGSDE